MEVAIEKITPFQSRHGGECLRIDGHHVNEQGQLEPGYTFVDPRNDNAPDWADVIDTVLRNRGRYVICDGVRMKSRDRGLWSADSKPRVTDVVNK
jgi:hypothetical protein